MFVVALFQHQIEALHTACRAMAFSIADVGPIIVECLGTEVVDFLRCSRSLSTDRRLATAAVQIEGFTFALVHPMFAEDGALVQKAAELFQGGKEEAAALWGSLGPGVRKDVALVGRCCGRLLDFWFPGDFVPPEVYRRDEFIRNFVEGIVDVDTAHGLMDIYVEILPQGLFREDRLFALAAAKKGLWPFGLEQQSMHWTDDEEIMSAMLQSSRYLNGSFILEMKVSCMVLKAPSWGGREGVLHLVQKYPPSAAVLLQGFEILDEKLVDQVVQAASEFNGRTTGAWNQIRLGSESFRPHVWASVWRRLLRAGVLNVHSLHVGLVEAACARPDRLWESDLNLLVKVVSKSCFGAANRLLSVRDVARKVFQTRGLAIRSSIWTADKEMALIAVRQDGRALKVLSDDLKADADVVLAAIAQNWFAAAWVGNLPFSALQEAKRIAVAQDQLAFELFF